MLKDKRRKSRIREGAIPHQPGRLRRRASTLIHRPLGAAVYFILFFREQAQNGFAFVGISLIIKRSR